MPYTIKVVVHDPKPYKIMDESGKQVGESDARDKAERSIGYREEADKKKEQKPRSTQFN